MAWARARRGAVVVQIFNETLAIKVKSDVMIAWSTGVFLQYN